MMESLCKETALAMLASGLPLTLIRPGSKRPIGGRWDTRYRTEEEINAVFEDYPDAGIGLVLGDRGDGRGVIDLEIDSPEKAEATLKRIFPDGVPPTLRFHSNRGTHYLFQYDYRLAWIGQSVIEGEHYPGVEIRIGTTDPSRPRARQSVIPPTPRDGGEPRQFYSPDGGVIFPEKAIREWETLIAPLPEALFRDIDLFVNKVEFAEDGIPQWGANEVKRELLSKGTEFVISLVKGWGLRLVGDQPSPSGWCECHAIGRADKNPSAEFDPSTGVYVDFGGGERRLSLFSIAVELGVYANFPVAVNELGKANGIPPTRQVKKTSLPPSGATFLEEWSIPQDLIPLEVPPFPDGIFPSPIEDFLNAASKSIDCPRDYLAVCMMGAAGAAIGNSTHLRITDTYKQPPHLYAAFIGPPGGRKSAAVNLISSPLMEIDTTAKREYLKALEGREEDDKEDPSLRQRLVGSDSTKEAIAQTLADNPRGLGLPMDEIAALVSNLNAYRGGRGTDREFFLSVISGETIKINRKGNPVPLTLFAPCLSIWGALTPSRLPHLKGGDLDDGWFDRFVLSYPATPILTTEFEDTPIPKDLIDVWRGAIFRLNGLPFNQSDGIPLPRFVSLSPGALSVYREWFSNHREEMNQEVRLRGPWSKMEGFCLRFALILSLLDDATNQKESVSVDADCMKRACTLAGYHLQHAKKVYTELSFNLAGIEDTAKRILRRIAQGLRDREQGEDTPQARYIQEDELGEVITYRTLQRLMRLADGELDRVIDWFIRSGYLQLVPHRYRQGRPSTRYVINPLWDWRETL